MRGSARISLRGELASWVYHIDPGVEERTSANDHMTTGWLLFSSANPGNLIGSCSWIVILPKCDFTLSTNCKALFIRCLVSSNYCLVKPVFSFSLSENEWLHWLSESETESQSDSDCEWAVTGVTLTHSHRHRDSEWVTEWVTHSLLLSPWRASHPITNPVFHYFSSFWISISIHYCVRSSLRVCWFWRWNNK